MDILDKLGAVLLSIEGANLRGAHLEGAHLEGAHLESALYSLGIPRDITLPQRILDQLTAHPESWDQTTWHNSCGTTHCIAGWACELSGPLGHYLDLNLSTETAATLLLWHPTLPRPSFTASATEEETLARLRALAEAYAAHA